LPSCAIGTSIISACASERPEIKSSSSARSIAAESEIPSSISGRQRARSSPISFERSAASRARIQATLPSSVLISPLWAEKRCGWASSQLGKVLVEKRE